MVITDTEVIDWLEAHAEEIEVIRSAKHGTQVLLDYQTSTGGRCGAVAGGMREVVTMAMKADVRRKQVRESEARV